MEVDSRIVATILAVIVSLFGIGFALGGAFLLERRLKALRFGTRLKAVITRYGHQPKGYGVLNDESLQPYVEIALPSGATHEAFLSAANSRNYRARHPIGTKLDVRIDPARPDIAFTANLFALLTGPVIMLLGGLLSMAIGWGVWNGL